MMANVYLYGMVVVNLVSGRLHMTYFLYCMHNRTVFFSLVM